MKGVLILHYFLFYKNLLHIPYPQFLSQIISNDAISILILITLTRVNSRRCTDRTFKPFHTRKYKIYENGTTAGEMNAATLPVEKYDHPVVNPMNESLEIQT